MTKYDIKLRRNSLTQGQIERHKDFKGLAKSSYEQKRSYTWIKLAAAIVAVVVVVVMLIIGFIRVSKEKKASENPDMELFEEFKTE